MCNCVSVVGNIMEQEGGVVEEFEEEFGAQENDCFLLCKVNYSLGSVQVLYKQVFTNSGPPP